MIFSALFWQSGVFSMYFVFLLLFIFVSLRFPPCCCNWMLVSTLSVKMFHFSNILGSPKAVKPSMKHRCIFSCGGRGKMGVIYLQLQSSRAKTTNRICLHTHTHRYRVYRCLAHATQSVSLLLSFVVVVAVVVFRRFAKQSQKHPPITKSAAPNRLFALSNFAKHWSSSVQFHRNVREFSHILSLTLRKK